MSEYVFYRGDTFNLLASLSAVVNGVTVTDLTGYTLESQIRDPRGGLIATLSVEWIDASIGKARLFAPGSTGAWSLTHARMNVRLISPGGDKVSSDSVSFEIEEPPTR